MAAARGPKITFKRTRSDAGFSVLEALVAMAILASALLPLLALQGQFVKTTQALELSEQRLTIQDTALAHISALNLDQVASGEINTPYGQIKWTADPAFGSQRAREAGGYPSRFNITLYNVEFVILYNNGRKESYVFQGIGWHPTSSAIDSL